MSQDQHEADPEEEPQLEEDDIVDVVEDDGDDQLMDEDDEPEGGYDGEIVIGGPGPGEEEAMGEVQHEDNSWGATSVHAAQQSIFSLSLHPAFPNPPLALSGGEDDTGYIFSPIPSGSFSSENFPPTKLSGHTDSVAAADWSFDGEYVATGGMDGHVRVWRRVKGRKGLETGDEHGVDAWRNWEFLTDLETGSEIQWLTWHPKGLVLAAGCEDSSVWLWTFPRGQNMTVLSSHTLSTTCGIFPPPNGRQLLTTALDSSLVLWEISTATPVWKMSVFSAPHSPELDPALHGITSLAVSPNGQIAAVGGAAGGVKLINLTKGDVIMTLSGHAEGESIEALEFVDLLSGAGGGKGVVLVSAGTDGKGFVWDVNTGRVRAELQHDEPITSLAPHPAPQLHLVTSASADGTLKTWDIRTGALVATHKGHTGVVNGVSVAPAPSEAFPNGDGEEVEMKPRNEVGQVVVSGGDEGVSLIWRI